MADYHNDFKRILDEEVGHYAASLKGGSNTDVVNTLDKLGIKS